ncbi:MAG: TRAP transporter large permease subunit [Alphaproteobacteria bacterium]|nr:TRAP transporter large permease subunit [Alphaproteobacteria bacterium]
MATSMDVSASPPSRFVVGAATLTRGLDSTIGALVTGCLIAMIGIVGAGVFDRYILHSSLAWSEEVSIWLFLCIIFLGLPLSVSREVGLSLGGLSTRLGGVPLAVLKVVNDAIVAYVLVLLAMGAWDVAGLIGGVTPVLGLPSWIPYSVLVANALATLVFVALKVDAHGRISPLPLVAIAVAVLAWAVFHRFELVILPDVSPSLVAFIAFLVSLILGVPVAFAMLFGVFLARLVGAPIPEAGIVQQLAAGASKFLLLAIPFFLTAGTLMNIGGLATQIINFAATLVGHIRGGLGQVVVATATMFAGISGSSISEAAVAAKLFTPDLVRNGYPRETACAMIAAASVIPNIIPPSIALLLLASSANLSVGDLWMAGVLPGLALSLSLMLAIYVMARIYGYGGKPERAPLAKIARTGLKAAPILLLMVIILGGIRFGIVTPTESGVLAVLYALFLGLFVYRAYDFRTLRDGLSRSAVETALVGLLIGASAPFAFIFIAERVPQEIVAFVSGIVGSKFMMLLLVNLALLFFGMILDIGVAILILTPMLMPLALQFGVDPIHFGIIVAVNLMLGGLTPPVGMLVYVTSSVTNTPADGIFRAMGPTLLAMLGALTLISALPWLSLGLIR